MIRRIRDRLERKSRKVSRRTFTLPTTWLGRLTLLLRGRLVASTTCPSKRVLKIRMMTIQTLKLLLHRQLVHFSQKMSPSLFLLLILPFVRDGRRVGILQNTLRC